MQHLLLFLPIIMLAIPIKYTRVRKWSLIGIFIVLYIFSAIRYDYGNDYFSYYDKFNQLMAGGNPFGTEIVLTVVMLIFRNYYVVIAVTSAVFLVVSYFVLKKYMDQSILWLALFLFLFDVNVFYISLSAIRQMLAISFFLIAITFSYKRKPLLYLLFIALAILSHKSSIVLIPFYFVANDKEIKKLKAFYIVFVTIMLTIVLLPKPVVRSVIEFVLKFFGDANYNFYFGNDNGNNVGTVYNYGTIIIYLLACLPKLKGKTLMFAKLYLVNAVLGVLCYHVSMIVRFQMYFEPFVFLAIPLIMKERYTDFLQKQENTIKNLIIFILVDVILPLLIFRMYYVQYRWFFTDELYARFHEYHTIFQLL